MEQKFGDLFSSVLYISPLKPMEYGDKALKSSQFESEEVWSQQLQLTPLFSAHLLYGFTLLRL